MRLLVGKGIFNKEEFLEKVKVLEGKRRLGGMEGPTP
jgi:hypothetical protein